VLTLEPLTEFVDGTGDLPLAIASPMTITFRLCPSISARPLQQLRDRDFVAKIAATHERDAPCSIDTDPPRTELHADVLAIGDAAPHCPLGDVEQLADLPDR